MDYHVISDMTHYGIYGAHQETLLKMELDWFDKRLGIDASEGLDRKQWQPKVIDIHPVVQKTCVLCCSA